MTPAQHRYLRARAEGQLAVAYLLLVLPYAEAHAERLIARAPERNRSAARAQLQVALAAMRGKDKTIEDRALDILGELIAGRPKLTVVLGGHTPTGPRAPVALRVLIGGAQ